MEITLENNSEVKTTLINLDSTFRIGDLYFHQFKRCEIYHQKTFESIEMFISSKSILTPNDVRFRHFDLFEIKEVVDINTITRDLFLKSISKHIENLGWYLPSRVNKELGIKSYSSREYKIRKLKELFLENNSKKVYVGAGNQYENLVPLSKKRLASFLGFKIQQKMFFGVKDNNPTHFYAR